MKNVSQALALAAVALCIMVLITTASGAEGAGIPGGGPGQGTAPPSGPGTTQQPGTGTQADPGAGQGQQNRVTYTNPVSPPAQPGNSSSAVTPVPTTVPVTQKPAQVTPVQKNTTGILKNEPGVTSAGSATPPSSSTPPDPNTGGSLLPVIIALVVLGILAAGSYAIYKRKRGTRNQPPAAAPSVQTTVVAKSSLPSDEIQHPASFPTLPAELSERYTSTEFVGKGGFAAVFKATKHDGTIVAVKVPLAMNSSTGKTFIAEIQNWTKLSHPNIVRVYDYNIMPVPYLELEYCDSSLACLARPLTCIEAEMLIFGVCEGLKFTHAHGLIHRDLKPENILLKDWVPKISDWGLSKEIDKPTVTTTAIFTPSFAAPEQINRQHKDERTDIWQLGVILYNLMTGEEPFPGESAQDIMTGILMREPRHPKDINPDAEDLDGVITQCLQKDPALRYQSVFELQTALADHLNRSCEGIFDEWKRSGDLLQYEFFYGEVLLINLKCGNIAHAFPLALDIQTYVTGTEDPVMEKIVSQLNLLLDSSDSGIPPGLIQDAESIVNRIKQRNRQRAQGSGTTRNT